MYSSTSYYQPWDPIVEATYGSRSNRPIISVLEDHIILYNHRLYSKLFLLTTAAHTCII